MRIQFPPLTCKLVGSVEVVDILDENLDGAGVDLELLEDGESLLEELAADGDVGDVRGVVVVQPVDVFHHLGLVRLDGRQDQQVLQVPGRERRVNGGITQNILTE